MPKTIFHIRFLEAASSSLKFALVSCDMFVCLELYPTRDVSMHRENRSVGVPYSE